LRHWSPTAVRIGWAKRRTRKCVTLCWRFPGSAPFTAYAILLRVLGRPEGVPLELVQFADAVARVVRTRHIRYTVRQRYGRYVGWWSYLAKTALAWRGVPTSHGIAPRRVA
jgi:hypothetical protein